MGCQYCSRNVQIYEEEKEEKKEEIKKDEDELKFDIIKARKLVKLLLAEDTLYKQALNYVILFTDEQFENLFKGNLDYKKFPYQNIHDKTQFEKLLLKFEDFNDVLYEFYKDENTYDNLIRVWKSKICISALSDLSDFELEELLNKYNLTDINDFITECLLIINNSTNKKAVDIRNYLKDEFIDFYSLIQVSNDYKEEFNKTKMESKEIITTNLDNIVHKLIEKSMPLVKDYIAEKFPNLNILSKIELKSGMLTKLKTALLDGIKGDISQFPKGINFNTVQKLVNLFQNGDDVSKLFNAEQVGPWVTLATSFLNLATNVKTYYDDIIEYEETNRKYTNKLEELHEEFERLKKQIGTLDLDNYEESMATIIQTGKKMNSIKQQISVVIEDLDKEEKKTKEKKTGSIIGTVASTAVGAVGLTIAGLATGGFIMAPLIGAGVANAITCGVNVKKLIMLKQQLNTFRQTKMKEVEKFKEIDAQIEILNKKCEQIRDRYIPPNLLKG